MRLLLLASFLALAGQSNAAVFTDDSLDSAELSFAGKSVQLELEITEKDSIVAEATEKTAASGMLVQKSFTDTSIKGYACNISHTPSEANKWSIILYNFNDPSDDGEVVFSTNKNRKIQSVACLPNGEKLIFSYQETTQGDTEIYSLNLLTNEVLRLTDNDTDDSDVTISQDGTVLAWQNRLPDNRQAITMRTYNADGSEFTEKSIASANPFVQPSLSANGRWLALVQLRTNTFLALRYDLMSGAFKTIHSIPRRKRLFNPSVSDDGNIYSWVENKALSRYVVKNISENTLTRVITGVEGIEHPFLSQNGESVIYSIGGQTLIKNIRTGVTEEVAFAERYLGSYWMGLPEAPSIVGSWSIDGEEESLLHFLPDGRYFAMKLTPIADGGFEYGTYVLSDGEIKVTTVENSDGDQSLICAEDRGVNCTDATPDEKKTLAYSFSGENLLLTATGGGGVTLEPIVSSSPVFGLWEFIDETQILFYSNNGLYLYVDYLDFDESGDTDFDVGRYELTTVDGNTQIDMEVLRIYGRDGLGCDSAPCETTTLGYYLTNGQLALMGENFRALLTQPMTNDSGPANTAKLVTQKQYANDAIARNYYGLDIDDGYRVRLRTRSTPAGDGGSASAKFTIDESSSLETIPGGNSHFQARLSMKYEDGSNTSSDGEALNVDLRVVDKGNAPYGQYSISRCFDPNCDNEVFLSGIINDIGEEIAGDYSVSIEWDDTAKAFNFAVNGKTASMPIANYTQREDVLAAGGYSFNINQFYETEFTTRIYDIDQVGESGYFEVYVDEININGSLYDDFASGLIDNSKWRYQSGDF